MALILIEVVVGLIILGLLIYVIINWHKPKRIPRRLDVLMLLIGLIGAIGFIPHSSWIRTITALSLMAALFIWVQIELSFLAHIRRLVADNQVDRIKPWKMRVYKGYIKKLMDEKCGEINEVK